MPQHATIDGEIPIAHFVAVRHPLPERCLHRGLAGHLQRLHSGSRSQKILNHVTALTERRFEFFEDEKDFPVVASRLMLGLYVNWPDLAAVLSSVEIGSGPIVGMIEAETGSSGSDDNPPHPMGRDEGCPFLRRTIHIRRNELSVPMQLLRDVRITVYFHCDRPALFEAQQGARGLTDL